jgi:hypothetical protein
MDKPPAPTTKQELLAELDQEWARIERICFNLSEGEMCKPGTKGDWSIKDLLCHLAAWEKYLLDRLSYVLSGQKPQYPIMQTWDDVHRFNAQVYEQNKDRPLTSAVIEFRSLYRGVMTVLDVMDNEQLNQPYNYDFTADKLTLLQLIRANTYEHYQEHCIDFDKGE